MNFEKLKVAFAAMQQWQSAQSIIDQLEKAEVVQIGLIDNNPAIAFSVKSINEDYNKTISNFINSCKNIEIKNQQIQVDTIKNNLWEFWAEAGFKTNWQLAVEEMLHAGTLPTFVIDILSKYDLIQKSSD